MPRLRKVNNREPSVSEPYSLVRRNINPRAIRPTVGERVPHARQNTLQYRSVSARIVYACYATHTLKNKELGRKNKGIAQGNPSSSRYGGTCSGVFLPLFCTATLTPPNGTRDCQR